MDDAEDGAVGAEAEREVPTTTAVNPGARRSAMELLRPRHSTERASSRQAGVGIASFVQRSLVREVLSSRTGSGGGLRC